MKNSILIDAEGRNWSVEQPIGLASIPRDPYSSSYAIHNLGFIRLDFPGASTRVSFRPGTVDGIAMAGAFLAIAASQPKRVALRYYTGAGDEKDQSTDGDRLWNDEIFGDFNGAFHRMEALVDKVAEPEKPPQLFALRRSLDEIAQIANGRLAIVMQRWREAEGILHERLLDQLAQDNKLERMLLVRQEPRTRRMVFEFATDGYLTAQYWGKFMPGQDVEALFDRGYGRSLAETYHSTQEEEVPRLEFVDTTVRVSRIENRRACYHRLLLPWRSPGGDRLVMSTSVLQEVFRDAKKESAKRKGKASLSPVTK